jgi:hypothetical protein
LLSSRLQSWVCASLLTASVAMLSLGATPNAVCENSRGLPSAAGISWGSVCQTDVCDSVSCSEHVSLAGDAAPVEFPQILDMALSSNLFVGTLAGREFSIKNGQLQPTTAQNLPAADDQTGPPPDETPAGAKVPEPASMILLGLGLITISKMSRSKRQPRQSQPVSRLVSGCQDASSLV